MILIKMAKGISKIPKSVKSIYILHTMCMEVD